MVVPAHLRRQVVQRAQNRCEYCGLAQVAQEATFHADHVIPVSAGGRTALENLALACVSCSLRKGARQTAIDPHTSREFPLFNPRRDSWRLHFRWQGVRLLGISPTGRATVAALKLNRPVAQAIREEEATRGRHPSPRHL
ncbi:MAG: HNH endonuclease [Verrucomicrobia bacterium]|nr:HNH endonuclease [Verrucomicrobiota bacterium]